MSQNFVEGDFLIFQIESGYGLLRVLAVDQTRSEPVWHVAAYNDLFLDVEMADQALKYPETLTVSIPHVALTNRAFKSTQVARMTNIPLEVSDFGGLEAWKRSSGEISDRSIRLMMGLR